MEPYTISEAAARLKQGDTAAFAALYEMYERRARGWAMSIVRDPHLAEDVVQEAFVAMNGKIGGLQEPDKFPGWFRQIVRRTAINHIRGAANRAMPTDAMPETAVRGGGPDLPETDRDPLRIVQRKEGGRELVADALRPLTGQAKQLLMAHAAEQLSPEELAERYRMKKSNVYNVLSRSRMKANEERYSEEIRRHIADRRRRGLPARRQLEPPYMRRPYALMSVLLWELLSLSGESHWTLPEVMAATLDAFRLSVPPGCDWKGISTFDWSFAAYRAFEQLGFSGSCFGRPGRTTLSPEQQANVLSFVQDSVDRGLPAVVWNVDMNQFGFIYGYDDAERVIHYSSYPGRAKTVRFEQLGRSGEEPAIFAAALRRRVSRPSSELDVLRAVVRHARGAEPPVPGFVFGLQGYDKWLEAVERDDLDLQGHAYMAAILAEARQQASLYLQGLSAQAAEEGKRTLLSEAAGCYGRAGQAFERMYPSFPFGYGGGKTGMERIREQLLEAKKAETKGIRLLETFLSRCDRKESDDVST